MSNDKILDRIRKLLAMANDERGNDNERETALRQAHAMLTKHGLELADVEAHEREKMDPRGCYDDEGWSMGWTRSVRNHIAKLFMCSYYYGRKINGTREVHHFVGRESNAMTAMYMSSYVINSILKEGRRLYKHNLSPETRAFATGCSVKLRHRIDKMIADKAAEVAFEQGTGTSLVLMNLIKAEEMANQEFTASWNISKSKSRAVTVDGGAYSAGMAYGDKINLSMQVGQTKQQSIK